jgi:hypothetical protein
VCERPESCTYEFLRKWFEWYSWVTRFILSTRDLHHMTYQVTSVLRRQWANERLGQIRIRACACESAFKLICKTIILITKFDLELGHLLFSVSMKTYKAMADIKKPLRLSFVAPKLEIKASSETRRPRFAEWLFYLSLSSTPRIRSHWRSTMYHTPANYIMTLVTKWWLRHLVLW